MPNIFFNRRFIVLTLIGLMFIFYLYNNRQSPHIDLSGESIDQRHVNETVNEDVKNGTITATNQPAVSGYTAYESNIVSNQQYNIKESNNEFTIKQISSENTNSTTSKFVRVGSTKEHVISTYGETYTVHINNKLKTYLQYTDTKNNYSIQFHLKDDIVEKIVLEDTAIEYRLKKLITLPVRLPNKGE